MAADRAEIMPSIVASGVVAVIRANSADDAVRIGRACLAGGIRALEVTFTTPGALPAIEALLTSSDAAGAIVGAGTVLDGETARCAILSGAQFVVSPCLSKSAAELCNRYGVPYMPGAMTVREIVEALEHGAQIVKLFPGELFGPRGLKAFLGPLPHVKLMPTGGVSLENVPDWVAAGAVAVGIGGNLTKPAATGDYDEVTRLASQYIAAVSNARRSVGH